MSSLDTFKMCKNPHQSMRAFFNSTCDHISHTVLFLHVHHRRVLCTSARDSLSLCVECVCDDQGVDTAVVLGWLYHLRQLLLSQVLGKQTTQSAYMLCALRATGSLHVHGALCLICCFDVCIKIISSLGVCVLWEHWRPCKRNTSEGGRVCWMAFTSLNPNRNIFMDTPF